MASRYWWDRKRGRDTGMRGVEGIGAGTRPPNRALKEGCFTKRQLTVCHGLQSQEWMFHMNMNKFQKHFKELGQRARC